MFIPPAPTLRNQSAFLKHPTYPSIALHVPDIIPLPRHPERVHRHLPAQPRREASRSVRSVFFFMGPGPNVVNLLYYEDGPNTVPKRYYFFRISSISAGVTMKFLTG